MASAEFSDERRLSNPDLSDDRRKSSVRRLSVNEPGKKNVKRGFQAGLTTEMEDEHFEAVRTEPRCSAQVFRPDKNQTMFSNSEAFAVAKANFVKLVGQVEPVADRIAQEAEQPRTALQKEVMLRKNRFSGAHNSSSYIAKRNELKRWKETNKEIAGPAGKRAFALELDRINRSKDDDDVKAQKRLELQEKMIAAGVKEEEKVLVKQKGIAPRVNYDFVEWNPGDDSFPCPTAANYREPDGPAHFRLQQRIEEFKRETELQSAARRETDREQEEGTLAAVLKERRYQRMRDYFNSTVKKHEEEAAEGISVDTAERKRRALLRSERRKRMKENPHGIKFKGSRKKSIIPMKIKKGMCPCFGKKRRMGTADSQYTATPPSTAGTRPSTAEDHLSGFKNMFFGAVKEAGSRASTAASRAGSAMAEKTAQATGGRFDPTSWFQPKEAPASPVERICVKGCGFCGSDEQVAEHEKTCTYIFEAGAPAPAPTSPGKKKKKSKRNRDFDDDGACKCPKGCGWSGDAKELKKHEKSCDFVKDPTRRACKNNCGFYGLLDATARHEVNCDFVDPRIAKREARLAKESPPKKESKGARRLRLKGLNQEEAPAPAPVEDALSPKKRRTGRAAGGRMPSLDDTPVIEEEPKKLSLYQKYYPRSSHNKQKKLQKKLDKAQEAVDASKQSLRDAEALPTPGPYKEKKIAAAKVSIESTAKKFAEVQKKYNKVHEAKAPAPPGRKKWFFRSKRGSFVPPTPDLVREDRLAKQQRAAEQGISVEQLEEKEAAEATMRMSTPIDEDAPIKPHRRSGVTPCKRPGKTKLRRRVVVPVDPDAVEKEEEEPGKKKKRDKPMKVPRDLREEVAPLAEQYFLFLGDDLLCPVNDYDLLDAAANNEQVIEFVKKTGHKMFQYVTVPHLLDPAMKETETHMPGKFIGEEFVNAVYKAISTKLTIDELRRQERLKKQEERKMKELQMVKKLHVSTAEAEEEKRIQAAITEEKEKYKKKHLGRSDLGVPLCRGAFTPSTRLVSMREDGGWSFFRYRGRSDRDRDAPRRWERRFCGCFVSLDKDEQVWREEEKKKEEELMADMSYEEKQQYRKDKKWKKSIGYKIHKFKKKYFFWMRYPRIDDLFVPYRTVKWLYSKCGIPRPVIRFALWSVKTGESIATWWGLRFAKVYFGLKVVYKALSNFVSGAAQYDYDDLTAAVLEGNVDMLRLIFMDKHSAMSAEETSLDGKTMLFMCMERLLHTEHTLKTEMARLAKEGRVAPNLFYLPVEQQKRELEEVQQEDDAKRKVADKEALKKEREEQKRMRRETKKGTNIQSGMAHLQKKKKKMSKQEKMKADALREASALDLFKKAEKLAKTCEFLVKRGSSINTQQDPRKHDGSGWGLLHHAAAHSNVKQMKWILSKGALVDLATEEGETPLMMAALSGATRGCQFLIEYGAVVTKAANNGWTPLHFAGHAGANDTAALLLRAGASKDARTIGDTLRPADCAVNARHKDTAEIIRLYREPPVPVKEVFDMMDAHANRSVSDSASALLTSLAGETMASLESAQSMFGLA